jgi:hypothetical protein
MRLQELVQAAGLCHPREVNAHHIVRRLTDTEVRLLSNLIMQVEPGALLGSLEKQNTVFSYYWPLASAHSFRANGVGPGGQMPAQDNGIDIPLPMSIGDASAERAAA